MLEAKGFNVNDGVGRVTVLAHYCSAFWEEVAGARQEGRGRVGDARGRGGGRVGA